MGAIPSKPVRCLHRGYVLDSLPYTDPDRAYGDLFKPGGVLALSPPAPRLFPLRKNPGFIAWCWRMDARALALDAWIDRKLRG